MFVGISMIRIVVINHLNYGKCPGKIYSSHLKEYYELSLSIISTKMLKYQTGSA